jgi:hypothetical protein
MRPLEAQRYYNCTIATSNDHKIFTLIAGGSRQRYPIQRISFLHNHLDYTIKEVRPMSLQCPRCHSPEVASFHHAMKVGAALGTVGGAARGASAVLAGGQAGALIGAIAGPVGITLGSVSGAIPGGLAGGVGGCALGAQLGESLDGHVPAHNLCLLCGHRFNTPT